jgi:hypothetical protein
VEQAFVRDRHPKLPRDLAGKSQLTSERMAMGTAAIVPIQSVILTVSSCGTV